MQVNTIKVINSFCTMMFRSLHKLGVNHLVMTHTLVTFDINNQVTFKLLRHIIIYCQYRIDTCVIDYQDFTIFIMLMLFI